MYNRRTFIKNGTLGLMSSLFILMNSCTDDFLNTLPEDSINGNDFPKTKDDLEILLMGIYASLRANEIYNEGFLGFGVMDGATPNAYNWGSTVIAKIGRGDLNPEDGEALTFIWKRCYTIIFRANFFMENVDAVEDIDTSDKNQLVGEARFLRGLAYSILADAYGGSPIITSVLKTEDARQISRGSVEETWSQVVSDYDFAIENLSVDARGIGRATKGAAIGMKMRAYLYQNKYNEILPLFEDFERLNKYSLFASYDGLFKLGNENNQEVIFDVQYARGENNQGSLIDQYCGTGTGSFTRGTRYVPTEDLVDAYERIDGTLGIYSESNIDLDNPYEGWDPRMKTTVVVPGSYFLGFRFPNYIYQGGAYNHPGNRFKKYSTRKYRIEPMEDLPPAGQSDLNYIILRYADILLMQAEALIETQTDAEEGVNLINRIRTERDDVKLIPLPMGLSLSDARTALRHERRIEFALEGLYWSDIRRWEGGDYIYPVNVKDLEGGLIEAKFPNGYDKKYRYLPIPSNERSLNDNLSQNEGW